MRELAYRIRASEPEDEPHLRWAIGVTMAHPEGKRKRFSFRAAAERGELLVLEQHHLREGEWQLSGFVEYHVRVDDTLTIKDAGSVGATPHGAIIKQLLAELLRSAAPQAATLKLRSDASAWNELLESTPGFYVEGTEYRRPHYYLVWRWSPELALRESRRLQRAPRGAGGRK